MTRTKHCAWTLVFVFALGLPAIAHAQHAGHATTATPEPAPQQQAPAQPDHSRMDHSRMDHSRMDHSRMDHSKMDHSKMDHLAAPMPREPIAPISDADRAAAFPDVHAHHAHGTAIHSYWLLDRLELAAHDGEQELGWEGTAWIGGDVQKLWLRSEGHATHDRIESGNVEVLYGRGVRAWWDVVAGVRQDFGDGPSSTWAAVGVQGLVPYKFEVSATAYVGQAGRTAASVEAEYDTLLTNRLILQWRAEAEFHGQDDPARGVGSGLSAIEAGLRLRYEIHRQFAPYIGLEREQAFGQTATLRTQSGQARGETSLVAGVRMWF